MTKLLTPRQIPLAAEIIRNGGIVVFRTETVFGLGADAGNPDAVQKIFAAKNRPPHKNLVLQFPALRAACRHLQIGPFARRLLKKFPGLTVVLENDIAVRIPADRLARRFLRACKKPLVVTSANLSDCPPAVTWEQAYAALGGRVDAIITSRPARGRDTRPGLPSTVVRITSGPRLQILRDGATPHQRLIDFCRSFPYNIVETAR